MTIKELLHVLLPKMKIIVIFPVVLVIAVTGFISLTTKPVYSATTELMLLKTGEYVGPTEVDTAEKLIETYTKLAANPTVKNNTLKNLESLLCNQEGETLAPYSISLSLKKEEFTLYITATSPNPAMASNAANLYATNIQLYLQEMMEADSATIIVAAEPPEIPAGNRMSIIALVAGVVGLGLGVLLILALEFMDDTVKTGEDLAKISDVLILAEIPKIQTDEKENVLKIKHKKYSDGRTHKEG